MPMKLSEADWERRVTDWAKLRGWLMAHVRDARRQQVVGLPDWIMVRDGRLVCLELKKQGGRATPMQLRWLAELDRVPGCTARLAFPADWPEVWELLK